MLWTELRQKTSKKNQCFPLHLMMYFLLLLLLRSLQERLAKQSQSWQLRGW
jgi:hypothetical protein